MDSYSFPRAHGWRAFARYDLGKDDHDLYIAYRSQDGKSHAVAPLMFTETMGARIDEPTIGGAVGWQPEAVGGDVRGFLQALADAAWDLGIRPRQLAEHQSELRAVRYHLEDMRALAKVPQRQSSGS